MTPGDVQFTFDGRRLEAPPGASVASALLTNGIRSWRRTRFLGTERGLLCGIGNCFDCLVNVNEQTAVRACVTPLREGDIVTTSASYGVSRARDAEIRAHHAEILHGDVLVVGSGPAGLAAADAAVGGGVSVVLVDEAVRLGGQLLRQRMSSSTAPQPPLSQWLAARHPRLDGPDRLTIIAGTAIWQMRATRNGVSAWLDDGRRVDVTAVVLAPGATELIAPFPGWELPGVVSAGAGQALLKSHGQLIGRRVLVAGSGPFLFPVAASLADAGADVLAVVEALPARSLAPMVSALAQHRRRAIEMVTYAATLARRGVPIHTGQALARCESGPDGAVARAVVVSTTGRSHARVYKVDAVCTSFGFIPRLDLARQLGVAEETRTGHHFAAVKCDGTQATTMPGVFAAGEVTGIAGGEVAELEGALAGAAAAAHCFGVDATAVRGKSTGSGEQEQLSRLARARKFAERLSRVYRTAVPLSFVSDETIICRCEDVSAGSLRTALAAGAASVREIRNATRCGMGYCQGRICGPVIQLLLEAALGGEIASVGDLQSRPVVAPVPLAVVAADSDSAP